MAYNLISNGPRPGGQLRGNLGPAARVTAAMRVTAAASRPVPSSRAAIQAAAAPLPDGAIRSAADTPAARRPQPGSQGETAPVPVGLDPGVAFSAQPDLQDIGQLAGRDTEPHIQARRAHRTETGQARRWLGGRVHEGRRSRAAHPRVGCPYPHLPALLPDELLRLGAHLYPHRFPPPSARPPLPRTRYGPGRRKLPVFIVPPARCGMPLPACADVTGSVPALRSR